MNRFSKLLSNPTHMKIVGVAALPLLALLHAWVLSVLWTWFVVPLGVTGIGFAHAYGLTVFAHLLMYNANGSSAKSNAVLTAIVSSVLAPLLSLAFGAVAHLLM